MSRDGQLRAEQCREIAELKLHVARPSSNMHDVPPENATGPNFDRVHDENHVVSLQIARIIDRNTV